MTLLAVAGRPQAAGGVGGDGGQPVRLRRRCACSAPIRRLAKLTGGALVTALYRALGGAPAPLVSRGFQLTALDRYLTKPLFLAQHLHDRETIAHSEAVDDYMAHMFAYPGRTFGQLYHAFFRVNELADGKVELRRRARDRPGRRAPAGARVAGARRRARARGGGPPRGRAAAQRRRCGSRPRPAATSACSPAARRSETTWQYLDEFLAEHDPVAAGRAAPAEARRA